MPSPLLITASEISTSFRCDNCGDTIEQVIWKQCKICKVFDLCYKCGKLGYDHLLPATRLNHQRFHSSISENKPITSDCLASVLVEEAEKHESEARKKRRQSTLDRIEKERRIRDDYDMYVVMGQLNQLRIASSSSASAEDEPFQLDSLIARYYLEEHGRNIRVLSLDGGGLRGYMSVKILSQLVAQKYLPTIENFNAVNSEHKKLFEKAQPNFADHFEYFAGTSTGGLIAFCLAVNYNVLELIDLYERSSYYFNRNYLGPLIDSKYDPSHIHNKIDQIVNGLKFPDGTPLSAQNATLLDIRNLLNPDNIIDDVKAQSVAPYHGKLLEFVNEENVIEDLNSIDQVYNFYRIKREKVLLITSYNTTTNRVMIFNTSYAEHWGYRIADVLKATMAAPTYFPPYEIRSGKKVNGQFVQNGTPELLIDGGVFANNPELAVLWVIRMQWKKPVNYHLLSIGTGAYNTTLSSSTWGGYVGWIFTNEYLINTLMDAPSCLTQTITRDLAKFKNIRRMKLNYKMTRSMDLDDAKFLPEFDKQWKNLKSGPDFKALVYFYDKYIVKQSGLGK